MFQLHPRLAADTAWITDWRLGRVLLMNDCTYPWLILVPRRAGVTEPHHLSAAERGLLMDEIAQAARAVEALFRPDKINVAMLGNQVPQLHVHVVGRFRDDPAWPGPVWGAAPPRPYDQDGLERRLAALRGRLGATGEPFQP